MLVHDVPVHGGPVGTSRLTYALRCGLPPIAQMMIADLQANGYRHDPDAFTLVLVDAPQGFALRKLESDELKDRRVIVTTSNPCPEYWEDIWDFQPAVLLVGHALRGEVEDAIERVARGEGYRSTSGRPLVLSPAERVTLRYFARCWTVERIAAQRGVSNKCVYSTLANICDKLHLPTRRAAVLYYWGRTDLVD